MEKMNVDWSQLKSEKLKEKWNKLITHDLMNLYNESEPLEEKWINKVKTTLERFFENLKPSHNSDFIQFLEYLEIPQAPSNSPNKTEFHNGAVIMKDIILKKLKSLSRG